MHLETMNFQKQFLNKGDLRMKETLAKKISALLGFSFVIWLVLWGLPLLSNYYEVLLK